MRIRLTKWGNSLGIRLPKVFAVQMGLRMGEEVDLELRKNALVVSPVDTLDALLERITPENVHAEIDTGKPVGKEIW
ncbi:MAG: AbrB/MazE/SpoVT family DNA-binding domain-containing protein [Candidatus Peribacteraceae bacterium]|nr:AbrB/MazE/SpoVT family DNA-binding domain-containing protein [Candidatus Peribacteraceae bacterium]